MLDTLQNHLQLSSSALLLAVLVMIVAGMVRGFSGFGLSALVMASLALLIPPIALIPICFLLEAFASAVMFRGGLADGNRQVVMALVIGYVAGMPLGLFATHTMTPEISRSAALILILFLALLQLNKTSPAFLTSRWGVYVAGVLAGVATGLASIGGMVVALYVLSLKAPTREVRASLVLFLMTSTVVSTFWLVGTGTLNMLAFTRAVFFAPFVIVGVLIGIWLFRPSLEPFYKRFCLFLLMGLAGFGLIRLLLF